MSSMRWCSDCPAYQAVVVDESFRRCYCGNCNQPKAEGKSASSKTSNGCGTSSPSRGPCSPPERSFTPQERTFSPPGGDSVSLEPTFSPPETPCSRPERPPAPQYTLSPPRGPCPSSNCTCSSSSKAKQHPSKRKKSCKKAKSVSTTRATLNNELDWYRHLAKLELLSMPGEPCCPVCPPSRGPKVPLKKLCPRIKALAQPKKPMKKREYVKDPDDFPLPGPVKDWPHHCEWLESNAQPKMYFNPDCDGPPSRQGPKLRRLHRTLWLAQPKYIRSRTSFTNASVADPITKVSAAAKKYCPSENILKLAEPKPYSVGKVYQEHVHQCCLTFVSPRALKYKATTRIKKLACPKRWCMWYCAPHLYQQQSGNCRPCGCLDHLRINQLAEPKLCWMNPKDFRHVRFLSTYRMANQCEPAPPSDC